jgi:hypothetical protein
MTDFLKIIKDFNKWGDKNYSPNERAQILERQLVRIYNLYFDLKDKEIDFKDYEEPKIDYKDLYEIIKSNFPDFGFYNELLNINEKIGEYENAIGDAIDDITDIVKELKEIEYCIEHYGEDIGIYNFRFAFKSHIKYHLIGLLNFLKDK